MESEKKNGYKQSYLQSRNRDIDTENKHMDVKADGEMGWIERFGLTYIHYCV